jgi:hypothetical protein
VVEGKNFSYAGSINRKIAVHASPGKNINTWPYLKKHKRTA